MAYIPPKQVAEARQMDLLTYLQQYEPQELKRISPGVYTTRSHDSLKLSNGKWMWWSRGIGGRSALDYLIKVQGMAFLQAVETILGKETASHPLPPPAEEARCRTLLLPPASASSQKVQQYLTERGISRELIQFCLQSGRLYETRDHRSAVFVGTDETGTPRYGCIRGLWRDFVGEVNGSDKHYSFCVPASGQSPVLHVFESAIDLLSYGTLKQHHGADWKGEHLLSLAGVYQPAAEPAQSKIPAALSRFLRLHEEVTTLALHLDRDAAGRRASQALMQILPQRYHIRDRPPPSGKDCNDYLCSRLGLPLTKRAPRSRQR